MIPGSRQSYNRQASRGNIRLNAESRGLASMSRQCQETAEMPGMNSLSKNV